VSVLSGSASYALTETLSWKEGLNLKFKQAHGFYGIIIAKTARDKSIMREYRSGLLSHVFVWLTFAVMALSALLMFVTLLIKR